ncbi:hypothetical protein [Moraxella sp. RCAD0137]|uniref:hypothetical protein n=1 Tax=Moraxella sp. RCAD0137 TaxID=1775913 RepID=UPI000C9FBDB3|nr:hypothetical protein [Moraxella sp. RCAD0137]PNP98954.1 hypothetical protein AZ602_00645 [Moraxella sp. RCAD0137]
MTDQISHALENWQTMSIAERLSFVDDLMYHASDDDETLSVLHELFFKEVNSRADEEVIDALAVAISQCMDPQMVAQLAEQIGQTLGFELSEELSDGLAKRITGHKTSSTDEFEPATNPPKKRRIRKSATTDEEKIDQPKRRRKPKSKAAKQGEFVQETLLEFIEEPSGAMTLREVGNDEPLVSIAFSAQVKDMLGDDVRMVGQAMIHAAISSVVQRQSNFWHAHVYDEEPAHYS